MILDRDWRDVEGPWQDEPHVVEWKHAGLDCLIVRNPFLGTLCGYVRVPARHRFYGLRSVDWSDVAHVHGGVNKVGLMDAWEGWWVGFDCGHVHDVAPWMVAVLPHLTLPGARYRTVAYVQKQTETLAVAVRDSARRRKEEAYAWRYSE